MGALAVALVVVCAAWASRRSDGRKALDAAESALARGESFEAIALSRKAAEARCPGCDTPERAYAQLETLAADAEQRGDPRTALAAWRAVRAASLATTVMSSSSPRRSKAEGEIARLERRIELLGKAGAATDATTEAQLKAALASSSGTSSMVFGLLALGVVVFAAGAVRFVTSRALALADVALALAGGAIASAGLLFF
jgi:hypothetical protein